MPVDDNDGASEARPAGHAVEGVVTDLGGLGRGVFDLRVFEQSAVWLDQSGDRYEIDDLLIPSVADLVAYLEAHANHFYVERLRSRVLGDILDIASRGPWSSSEVSGRDAGRSMLEDSPAQWLAGTPLMRALRARLPAHGPPPGEATDDRADADDGGDPSEDAWGSASVDVGQQRRAAEVGATAADVSVRRDVLRDLDVGVWAVGTAEEVVVFDFDARSVVRVPSEGVDRLRTDGRWMPLARLLRCEVGEELVMVVVGGDGLSRPWASSSVVLRMAASSTSG